MTKHITHFPFEDFGAFITFVRSVLHEDADAEDMSLDEAIVEYASGLDAFERVQLVDQLHQISAMDGVQHAEALDAIAFPWEIDPQGFAVLAEIVGMCGSST